MSTEIAIIGAGFTGLAAARDLARGGCRVTVYEAERQVGGLAGAFTPAGGGDPLDRFYHHWFTSDLDIMALIEELGLSDAVTHEPSLTGVYFANRAYRLSTPLDLLRFPALPLIDRVRLGWMALRARRITDWRALEGLTAEEWLRDMAGDRVYEVIWAPLLQGKFGAHAPGISAVWIWSKLKLRGGSRSKDGAETLGYMRGSFARLAEAVADDIRAHGGEIRLGAPITSLTPSDQCWHLDGPWGAARADKVVATVAPPLLARMVEDWAGADEIRKLDRISYLANLCLVLELDRPLGETYWLNVNDPDFPFVGVIEHTNFQSAGQYGGRHIVYLSRYLAEDDPLYAMSDADVLEYAMPHLGRMFPAFRPSWVQAHHVWRARWAQPVVERHYSRLIPRAEGPGYGLYLSSMAQIYPEDRGTNYAVRAGRQIAARLLSER